MKPAKDLTGQSFGRLIVIERVPRQPTDRNAFWKCKCDCGNETIAAGANLGKTTFSCGCLAKETAANSLKGNTHQRTHNLSKTPEYTAWARIKQRCHNANTERYKNYGGRGISMCERWFNSFENFLKDMGLRPSEQHSINRKNNDDIYRPGNCEWALPIDQANNTTKNVVYDYCGEKLTLRQVLIREGCVVGYDTADTRLRNGWDFMKAVSTPPLR